MQPALHASHAIRKVGPVVILCAPRKVDWALAASGSILPPEEHSRALKLAHLQACIVRNGLDMGLSVGGRYGR